MSICAALDALAVNLFESPSIVMKLRFKNYIFLLVVNCIFFLNSRPPCVCVDEHLFLKRLCCTLRANYRWKSLCLVVQAVHLSDSLPFAQCTVTKCSWIYLSVLAYTLAQSWAMYKY